MKTKSVRSFQEPSKTKKLFLPLFLGGIMVLSTFAIIFSGPSQTPSPSSSYTYNDYTFRSTAQGWESTLQGQNLVLRHGPQELEALSSQFPFTPATSFLSLQKLYVSTMPDEPSQEAIRDFYLNSNILPPITLACVADVAGCESLPLKTCSDATATVGVVLFRIGEPLSFSVAGTCATFTAPTSLELTQMADTLLYTLYGVF